MLGKPLQGSRFCICAILITTLPIGGCGGATGGAAGGALWGAANQIANQSNATPVTPVQPYQSGDDNLSCADLNQEIGRAQERISRLIEQNERKELENEERHSLQNHIAVYGILFIITYPISAAFHSSSKENKEQYGTEDTRIMQTYQERIKHLESLGKAKACS